MGRALCLSLGLLFLANVIPSKAQSEAATAAAATGGAAAATAAGGATEILFDVKGNFTLNCTLPSDSKLQYIWKKNETLVDEIWDLKGRFILENNGSQFHVPRALEDDFGNYSCAAAGGAAEQRWAVRGRPIMRLPVNTNVVEGQKLKLVCKVTGKPYPEVTWQYTNSSEENAVFVEVGAVLGPRAELAESEQGVAGAALVLAAAERADAGRYRCTAAQATPGETVLRVKDMYAALWPFLGICAEVFVLCAIILVYEKRRTKPELDDSDTDNHDQKKS